MTISIKTPTDISGMRIAGKLAADVLEMIGSYVQVGVTTNKLNALCHDYIIKEQQAIPAPLNYGATEYRCGFPKSICTSINHVVCHGIPDDKKLKKGDIINIDVTVIKNGYYGDTSKMFIVGGVTESYNERLVLVTQECLYRGIEQVKPGNRLSDIAIAIEKHAHANYFSVVEDFCGHGIGTVFHENPQVLHYNGYDIENDYLLKEGMTFTIEPMLNAGKKDLKILKDGWTAVTKDRRNSAQWEHTMVVTSDGVEVLTLRSDEQL